ncbi:MAG TPA: hypothetical protein VKB83_01885, partial [Nitrosopumilaceae archaeon]|nr:hypothetical protein [Nitrosopumilaceae archaeon]
MTQNYINTDTIKLTEILKIDDSIRFVGKIKNRKLHSFVRRENKTPLLSEELDNMAHYQASVKANMENMFDSTL